MSASRFTEHNESIISIIDDEENVRDALVDQLEAMDHRANAYASAAEFLAGPDLYAPGCIIVDLQMPHMNGLDLQESLANCGNRKPIIFMTGNGSISTSVHAMKAGAIDYLVKPFKCDSLIAAIDRALHCDRLDRQQASSREDVVECAKRLTPRETEVMEFVSKGLMNKQIAYEMSISEIMVKLHRGRMMRKMKARSVPEIVRKYDLVKSIGFLPNSKGPSATQATLNEMTAVA